MSIIDTINNARNVTNLPAATGTNSVGAGAGAMDQNDFLRLMTTQLTTQDPFNPVDNTQMVAQMAQFSQVAGIATVQVDSVVRAGVEPTRRHDPDHPLADAEGNVWEAGVDTAAELIDMVETARQYQNNVQVLQTAKTLTLDTLRLGQ